MSSSSSQKPKSGFVAALEYTGIPPSLLKRPKLPGRNWLIFFGVTGSLVGAYIYDRRQCRSLREEYIGRVQNLAEEYSWHNGSGPETLGKDAHLAWPRKLTVYAAKWPGDEDYDVAMKYFRRYLKVSCRSWFTCNAWLYSSSCCSRSSSQRLLIMIWSRGRNMAM